MYKIKRFSLIGQKEYAAANTLLKMGQSNPARKSLVNSIMTPKQFKSAVGSREGGRLVDLANKNRNDILGARSISQVNNIAQNHVSRITPKRNEIINTALANRQSNSVLAQEVRQRQIDTADGLYHSLANYL